MSRLLYIPKPTLTTIKYGLLYNWYAAAYSTGGASIAPSGWHLPTQTEYETLRDYLGGWSVAGGYLKTSGTTYWDSPNTGADNSSGFSAMGAATRSYNTGAFTNLKATTQYWSSTETSSGIAYAILLSKDNAYVSSGGYSAKYGYSVRLIKDNSTNTGWMKDYDNNVYPTVKIGTQVWMAQNLRVTHYNDGTEIPEITDNTDWTNDTDGALCAYNNDWNNV